MSKSTAININQLVESITKRQKEIPKLGKKLQKFERDMALELYEHLVVDIIEEDYPNAVFDRLLDTLLIAHDAMSNNLTLEETKTKK